MTTIEVLEPAGQVMRASIPLSPLTSTKGLRLAILDNRKPNFLQLATGVAERLRGDQIVGSVAHYNKENAAVGATSETLDQIARSADLVLTGAAD